MEVALLLVCPIVMEIKIKLYRFVIIQVACAMHVYRIRGRIPNLILLEEHVI